MLRKHLKPNASQRMILKPVYHREKYIKMQILGLGKNVQARKLHYNLPHDSNAYLMITALGHRYKYYLNSK